MIRLKGPAEIATPGSPQGMIHLVASHGIPRPPQSVCPSDCPVPRGEAEATARLPSLREGNGKQQKPLPASPTRRQSLLQRSGQGAPPFQASLEFGWGKAGPSGQRLLLIFASGLRSTCDRRKLS